MNMVYPPLADIRRNLKIKWYRSPIEPETLKELTQRSDKKGSLQAFGHLFLFLATGLICFILWKKQIWIGFATALFLHGMVSSFFIGVAPHELNHGTVFRTKWMNRIFLNLFSTISMWNYHDYGMSHTHHHRYTLHPAGDREVFLPLEPNVRFLFLLQLFTIRIYSKAGRSFTRGGLVSTILDHIIAAFGIRIKSNAPRYGWIRSLHADQPGIARKSIMWSRWILIFHTVVLLVSIFSGFWVFPILITAAPYIANWAHYATGLSQHCGLIENSSDFRKNCRSIKLNPVLSFLYWHMNWHIEHHMYAAVPCYNLKTLHRLVSDDMPESKSLMSAWKEMRGIWKEQQNNSEYKWDTPVPKTAGFSVRESTELENSLGEIAPKEMT